MGFQIDTLSLFYDWSVTMMARFDWLSVPSSKDRFENSTEPKNLKCQIHCHQNFRSSIYFFLIFIKYKI